MTETQAFELARRLQKELLDSDTYTLLEVNGWMELDTYTLTCCDVKRVLFWSRVYDDHTEAELLEKWRADIAKAGPFG